MDLVIYIVSFFLVWFGAGLITDSVDRFSHKLKLSSFSFSFFILGILTSIPEFAVGLSAVSGSDPEIYVGNLIGGVVVIFFLIIPILAIFGNGVRIGERLDKKNMIISFLTMMAPFLALIDGKLSLMDGFFLIGVYFVLFYFIERQKGVIDGESTEILNTRSYSYKDILKILVGVGIVFISSNVIVKETVRLADAVNLSTFYLSLILLSFGTNLPEMSLALRALFTGKKDVALGDYIGSAAANTLLFGIFVFLGGGSAIVKVNYLITYFVIGIGFLLFYYFTNSKKDISRKEGLMLLLVYIFFVAAELL